MTPEPRSPTPIVRTMSRDPVSTFWIRLRASMASARFAWRLAIGSALYVLLRLVLPSPTVADDLALGIIFVALLGWLIAESRNDR
jgi:hypothetical protein